MMRRGFPRARSRRAIPHQDVRRGGFIGGTRGMRQAPASFVLPPMQRGRGGLHNTEGK